MKSINLPPFAPKLIESTRAMGYSLEAAVADIIDNSITAGCNNVWIQYMYNDNSFVAMLDDGTGMSVEKITDAMRYGSQNMLIERSSDDLGRFGLGLKTASLSQCRQLTVISKQLNEISACRWDFDYVLSTGEWSLLVFESKEIMGEPLYNDLLKLETGTLVIWKKLDRIGENDICFETVFLKLMTNVTEHLKLVFHRYLDGEKGINKLNIWMNKVRLESYDPFLVNKSSMLMQTEIIRIDDQEVHVTPYILPYISQLTKADLEKLGGKENLRENQGFYIYRNKRLITWGTWFRLIGKGELSKLARVKVDIPNTLDHEWTLDIKKSVVRPPESVRVNLGRLIKRISDASENSFGYRGRKELADQDIRVWNRIESRDMSYYEINRKNVLITNATEVLSGNDFIKMDHLFKLIEQNIPIHSIVIDFNKETKWSTNKKKLEEEDLETLNQYIDIARQTGKDEKFILRLIEHVEPFRSNLDEVKKIVRGDI